VLGPDGDDVAVVEPGAFEDDSEHVPFRRLASDLPSPLIADPNSAPNGQACAKAWDQLPAL
jgi:hypothetical protein